jgi:hypothetical protein
MTIYTDRNAPSISLEVKELKNYLENASIT